MNRIASRLGIFLCSLIIGSVQLTAQAQTTPQIALGNCKACATACEKTLNYCTEKQGKYASATTTNALKDCITACKSASEFLARGSAYSQASMATCINACNECAKTCESFKDDNNMKACADECRKTAGNCSKITH